MTRSILSGLLGLLSVAALASIPLACQSGGVGDPCTPEDEYDPQFAGFKVTQENIESRSFQCQTRICLVNHFQGRVTCPLGQPTPEECDTAGADRDKDGKQQKCVEAVAIAKCDADGKNCDKDPKKMLVWHTPGACQTADGEDNTGKACCIPGTDTPVVGAVCGQCEKGSKREAESTVYCSCRCGVAEGEPEDPDFNFCTCPDNFECAEIRPNVGLADKQITGKYCIKTSTKYSDPTQCPFVTGYAASDAACEGQSKAVKQ
jgi:hypothetical protein